MSHHVYILECADGTYYTGYTTDVERRVAEHNDGTGAKYTRGRAPVEVIHTETYESQSMCCDAARVRHQTATAACKGGSDRQYGRCGETCMSS